MCVLIMNDKIVVNPLGYVRGCIRNGLKTDQWKLVEDKGLLWLVNETAKLRVRGEL
jgi:hypothetical protein